MAPFLSIVCPTKDRPECIRVLLKSLANQTYSDFEVIVSDNADRLPCKNEAYMFAQTTAMDIKYYRTPKCMGICDSFETAMSYASGEYVMMVEDKTILYPDAVEKISNILRNDDLDILNFPWDFLTPYKKEEDIVPGILTYALRTGKVEAVNVEYALEEKFSCQKMELELDKEWNYGAILGGVFSKRIINKIRVNNIEGRLFDGIVPDRVLSAEALCIVDGNRIKFLDDHILIYNSNGRNTVTFNGKKKLSDVADILIHSREGRNYYDSMIFPEIAVTHNALASDFARIVDYVKSGGQYKREKVYQIPKGRLLAILEKRLKVFEYDYDEYNREVKLIEKYKAGLTKEEYAQYTEKWIQMNRGRLISPTYKREYDFPTEDFVFLMS